MCSWNLTNEVSGAELSCVVTCWSEMVEPVDLSVGLWPEMPFCMLSPTASLPEMWESRVWEVQLQALLHPADGLRVRSEGL